MADVDIQDEIQLGDDDEAKAVAVNCKAYEKCRSQTARLALIRSKRSPPRKFGRLFSSKLSRPLSFCLFSVPLWSSTRRQVAICTFFLRRLDDGLLSGTSLLIKPLWNSCSRLGSVRWGPSDSDSSDEEDYPACCICVDMDFAENFEVV